MLALFTLLICQDNLPWYNPLMKRMSQARPMNILVLEPYYGGSHRSFLDNLCRLPFSFELMTLPARKWKWRMRLAAPYYAQRLQHSGRQFDRILCSTFVDVAAFRGLAPSWVHATPLLTYFHENQFVYPLRVEEERDFHFALTNMTTALASDSLAFNSHYNLETFLQGIGKLENKSYDLKLEDASRTIREKSRVIPPGIDFSPIDAAEKVKKSGPPVIVWNHRWEHDKNPELFFNALFDLDREHVDYRLVVLGESFKEHPPIFEIAKERLPHRILQFGYVRSRKEYAQWLKQGDLILSTADHDFFGISVVEAVRAGCRPLLPDRLSYPELFPKEFLFSKENFACRLKEEVLRRKGISEDQAKGMTEGYSWKSLAPVYESWIREAKSKQPSNIPKK